MERETRPRLTVTASISTKDRYATTLPLTISAILNQTRKPEKLVIYDDSENRMEAEVLWETSPFKGLFDLAKDLGVEVITMATPRQGQVANHQHCLETAITDLIWRVDDDEIPESNCLETLLSEMKEGVGAVAGLVHHPGNVGDPPPLLDGSLKDIQAGLNLAWYQWNGQAREVEHLYSTFLYRAEAGRKAGGYPNNLSPAGHREESIFSHKIKRAGYALILTPFAKTYHLRESSGGIRSFQDGSLWERDEKVWQEYLRTWGAIPEDTKLIVADMGLGDHFLLKGIWNDIRRKHPRKKFTLALCYPEVFKDVTDVAIISIADAKKIVGDRYEDFSLYAFLWKSGWNKSVVDGMMEFWA